ncbi:MAG: tetratricopeptide repeat protein [Bryobacteraceae bacterium]|nr:tetratricopeptide repeat protein [Bryobacteraceae bacterium]
MLALLGLVLGGLALAIALDCLVGKAQTRRAELLLTEGGAAFDEGDLARAERIWKRAAACSAWVRGGPIFFLAHYNLANVLARLGKYRPAEKAARQAFQSIGSLRNSLELGIQGSYPEVRNCLAVLADSLVKQARYPEAIPYYEAVIGLWREADGEHSFHAGYYSQELGVTCCRLGLHAQALDHLSVAVETFRTQCGPNHPGLATALVNCGEAQMRTGRLHEAEQSLRRALEIRERMFGGGHSSVAAARASLGLLHMERGEYEEAATSFRAAIKIYEPELGEADAVVAGLKNNLADALRRQGQWNESEQLLKLAMSTLSKAEDPSLSNALETMAELKNQQGSLEEAADLYRQSREWMERAPSGDLSRKARLLHNEARVLRRLGDEEIAEELASMALSIREAIKNTPSPAATERIGLFPEK